MTSRYWSLVSWWLLSTLQTDGKVVLDCVDLFIVYTITWKCNLFNLIYLLGCHEFPGKFVHGGAVYKVINSKKDNSYIYM